MLEKLKAKYTPITILQKHTTHIGTEPRTAHFTQKILVTAKQEHQTIENYIPHELEVKITRNQLRCKSFKLYNKDEIQQLISLLQATLELPPIT